MNGCISKVAVVSLALLLPSLTSAASIYSSQLGCMSCHQGVSIQPDKSSKKQNQADLRVKKPVQPAQSE